MDLEEYMTRVEQSFDRPPVLEQLLDQADDDADLSDDDRATIEPPGTQRPEQSRA